MLFKQFKLFVGAQKYIAGTIVYNMLPANYNSIHGWCTYEKANALIDLVYKTQGSLFVELGVFGGRSLLPIALAAKKVNPSSKVIGIDAWTVQAALEGKNAKENDVWWSNINYEEFYNYTRNLMIENKVDSVVDLWKCTSRDAISKFEDRSIDILHQDSNHSEETSCEEVELYWNKVKPGCFWVFDDTDWSTTKKAQDLLLTKGYTIFHIPSDKKWTVYRRST